MASTARIFFAGIGTTFVILAVGFGGGLFLAKSTLQDQPLQARASSEPSRGVRVILPASTEPAIQVAASIPTEPTSLVQPVNDVQTIAPPPEKADAKLAEKEQKAERRRVKERKAKKLAAVRARRQVEPVERSEPGIMAFGGDVSRTNFFGN